jgi:hypothetical protein
MLVNIIKFFHILCVLSLLGGTFLCAFSNRFKKALIIISFFAILTGTFLVYPKHFTFHTPWIKAAYVLSFLFIMGMIFISWLDKKNKSKKLIYFFSIFSMIILFFIIHDAVNKNTFLF